MTYTSWPDKTPPINATGKYKLRDPWYVDPNTSYICEAIMGFEALAARGVNAYSWVYQPTLVSPTYNSLEQYNGDAQRGINIVTLIGADGGVIHVPSSYIESFPGETKAPYARLIVAVDCGPLPEDYPLADMMEELKQVAIANTGNGDTVIKVSLHIIPLKGFVDTSTEKNLAENRWDKMLNTVTPSLQRLTTTESLQKANTKVSAMESLLRGG